MSNQICWKCDRATGGCSWSSKGIPVKGWKANKTIIKDNITSNRIIDSYEVLKCPLFVSEPSRSRIMPGNFITIAELSKRLNLTEHEFLQLSDDEAIKIAASVGLDISVKRNKKNRRRFIWEGNL